MTIIAHKIVGWIMGCKRHNESLTTKKGVSYTIRYDTLYLRVPQI